MAYRPRARPPELQPPSALQSRPLRPPLLQSRPGSARCGAVGDLNAVAGDASRMISPLLAFQGAPQGSRRASRHFQGIAYGPHSRAGPVSAVGSGWPRLSGPMVAVFSVKERLVQHIFAAPGALPCPNFPSWCCCWHPRGPRCAQPARASLVPHFLSAVRCLTRAHGRAGRWAVRSPRFVWREWPTSLDGGSG